MEIVLSRELAQKRIFPAIDLYKSGTRKEELILTEDKLNASYRADTSNIDNVREYSLSNIKNDGEIEVKGFSNLLTKIARCCNPLPGDEIIGYISRGNGITIHRHDCETLKNYEFERLIECKWKNNSNKSFVGSITIIATDMPGLVATITKRLNDEN